MLDKLSLQMVGFLWVSIRHGGLPHFEARPVGFCSFVLASVSQGCGSQLRAIWVEAPGWALVETFQPSLSAAISASKFPAPYTGAFEKEAGRCHLSGQLENSH